MRVAVTGGRTFDDIECVHRSLKALDDVYRVTELLHGGATGADSLAASWARARGIIVTEYKADWQRHGRAAGPKRNAEMLRVGSPDMLIAFEGGTGTADCVRRAQALNIPVVVAIQQEARDDG